MIHKSRIVQIFACILLGALALDADVNLPARAQQATVESQPQPTKAAAGGLPSKFEEAKRESNSNTVTIMASSASSSYTRFAEDIQNVLDDIRPGGLRIVPMLGRGGGQNFQDILFLRDIDMGTTDADYLHYFKQKDPVLYRNVDKRIEYITKLFNAEFHVLAPEGIKSWSDLNGKKVNFFKPLSVTAMAAETIFYTLNIKVEPTFFDNELAIEKMRRGEISALVRMAGAPVNDYVSVRPEDHFHLVSFDEQKVTPAQNAELSNIYFPAALTHEQYPQLIAEGEQVPTVAGSIVLAVYAWPENSDRYQKLANFVRKFFDNIEKFHDSARHPKWRDVNLATNVPGWTRFKPAQDWLDAHSQVSATRGTGEAPLAGREKKVYEEFVRWRNSKGGAAPAAR
jgi:TRAP-type uncharacterized transport system substrate-binding protein